jgi:hypothetical protein
MLEDASHCYTAAQWRDVRPSLALSRYPPGLLPKSVVGWITHHTPDVGVLKPILPATFNDLYDPGQVNTKPPEASRGDPRSSLALGHSRHIGRDRTSDSRRRGRYRSWSFQSAPTCQGSSRASQLLARTLSVGGFTHP